MSVTAKVDDNGNVVNIAVSERFDFNSHHDFRNAYRNEKPGAKYIVNMSAAQYIDSSALGMLLLLREHAGNDKADISIKGCNADIMKIFEISNFKKLFDIS